MFAPSPDHIMSYSQPDLNLGCLMQQQQHHHHMVWSKRWRLLNSFKDKLSREPNLAGALYIIILYPVEI